MFDMENCPDDFRCSVSGVKGIWVWAEKWARNIMLHFNAVPTCTSTLFSFCERLLCQSAKVGSALDSPMRSRCLQSCNWILISLSITPTYMHTLIYGQVISIRSANRDDLIRARRRTHECMNNSKTQSLTKQCGSENGVFHKLSVKVWENCLRQEQRQSVISFTGQVVQNIPNSGGRCEVPKPKRP